ncbi:MAG: FdtA/QdtA family cupin domain-containing protein [Dysgonamonadaceae bacterium]
MQMKLEEQYKILEFRELGDERGNLIVVEGNEDIPFKIERVFYIYNSDADVIRGQHANRKTEFVLINVSGTSKVKIDNGRETKVIELDHPHMGLYLSNNLWKEMYDFSSNSLLLVLASEHYDDSEYIRDYDLYIREMQNRHTKEL